MSSLTAIDNCTSIPILSAANQVVWGLRERVNEAVISTMKNIVKENHERINGCNRETVKALADGCFYPSEYYKALSETGQSKRLEWFKNKNFFHNGYVSPHHFTHQKDSTTSGWDIKQGVTASEGLEAVIKGVSLIYCGEVCDLAIFKAIQMELGIEKFDALFASDSATPLRLAHHPDPKEPLQHVFCKIKKDPSGKIHKGNIVGIFGFEHYGSKHKFGEDASLNAICSDDTRGAEKFIGLGTKPEGFSREEVGEFLLQGYNKKPLTVKEILSPKGAAVVHGGFIDDMVNEIEGLAKETPPLTLEKLQHFINSADPSLLSDKQQLRNLEKDTKWTQSRWLAERYFEAAQIELQKRHLSKEAFIKGKGGEIGEIIEVDYDRIEQLKNVSIVEGKKLMASWMEQSKLISQK